MDNIPTNDQNYSNTPNMGQAPNQNMNQMPYPNQNMNQMPYPNKNMKACKTCGAPIAKNAKICPSCGAKNKKPVYKRGWFIAMCVVFVLIVAVNAGGGSSKKDTGGTSSVSTGDTGSAGTADNTQERVYQSYTVSEMADDIEKNALKAENKYKNQYVEISGRLSNIDSSGKYITLDTNDGKLTWYSVTCYIKNDQQKQQVMEMAIDDNVTIRGKITNVGEVLGYSLDIDEIMQ